MRLSSTVSVGNRAGDSCRPGLTLCLFLFFITKNTLTVNAQISFGEPTPATSDNDKANDSGIGSRLNVNGLLANDLGNYDYLITLFDLDSIQNFHVDVCYNLLITNLIDRLLTYVEKISYIKFWNFLCLHVYILGCRT